MPAYLIRMKPVLMVEGEAMLTGRAKTLGKTQRFVMEFITPGGGRDRVANDVTVGAYHGIGLNLGRVPTRLVEERKAKLTQQVNLFENDLIDSIYKDDVVGELLYISAITYFAESDFF